MRGAARLTALLAAAGLLAGCADLVKSPPPKPRLVMFVGVDVSKSFVQSGLLDRSLDFLAHYLYAHMNGLGGLDVPRQLFVGPIGGYQADEAKTLYPKDAFEGKTVEEIRAALAKIFPREAGNPATDFNAFFTKVADTVQDRKLILSPVSVLLLSDGKPYLKEEGGAIPYDKISLRPLDKLSRNVAVRLLYTDPVVGREWQTKVKRRNVKVWTQDAAVMEYWRDPGVLVPGKAFPEQAKLFSWIKENVDFPVRVRRVD